MTGGQAGVKEAVDQQFARWVMLHVQFNPPADLHPAADADQGQAHLMAFAGAVDATFASFGIRRGVHSGRWWAGSVRVIVRRPDAIVGFSETRIYAETATFEVRASEVASPRSGDQLTIGSETS